MKLDILKNINFRLSCLITDFNYFYQINILKYKQYSKLKFNYLYKFFMLFTITTTAQHYSKMNVFVDAEEKILHIKQYLTYNNISNDTLSEIILNDWNHAFSSKNSPLALHFSDEFIRAFHLAKEIDRGYTKIQSIIDVHQNSIRWERQNKRIDLVKVILNSPILPCKSETLFLEYSVKIPNEKFTKYGFDKYGNLILKHWYLTPSQYKNKQFIQQSNENLDDIPNALSNYEIHLEAPINLEIASNLITLKTDSTSIKNSYFLNGNSKNEVVIYLQTKNPFCTYKNEQIEVNYGLVEPKVTEVKKEEIIDRIVRFTSSNLGLPFTSKILISQEDYLRQPFYGLNQLPAFLSPFQDEFLFELKILKTYLNNYLKENLQLNPRNEAWIYDGIQVFLMMNYIEKYYPNSKMTGNLADLKLLKSYHFINLPFNQQYNYLHMLMARKNLDQALNEPKNKLIKFNEQIANKYKAGLSLNYLDNFLGNQIVNSSIKEFMLLNQYSSSNARQFETILEKNAPQKIDWFFKTMIETRDLIDFKFGKVTKTKDSISFTIINKTNTNVPISLYQLKNNTIVNKMWFQNIKTDSLITIPRLEADKIVLNYNNEVPEYNLRNNWKSFNSFFINNRPFKLNFFKDLEEPHYNQIFYVPEVEFNAYDGVAIGLKINNRSILNKPFTFSVSPMLSTNTSTLVGKFNVMVEDNIREKGKLYNIRYIVAGSRFHYAPNAFYTNFVPIVQFRFRDENLRKNKSELIQFRQVYINREKSAFTLDSSTENYNIFNAKYSNFQSEGTKHFYFSNDFQLASSFGKIATEIHYRKLFENNRQISLRWFFGAFMYRSTNSDFFSFGLDRPNDYMFDYNLLGRSEATGIYSQQYVYAEGGFKSKLQDRFANQWMSTINATFNIWNWIQVYSDVGMMKNKNSNPKFLYDSGLHLNLVPDYFELFFPVYSSNGFELNSNNYGEKIRFVITLSPKTLVSLFTRKWF